MCNKKDRSPYYDDRLKSLHWPTLDKILKLINNSTSYNKGIHNRDGGLEI